MGPSRWVKRYASNSIDGSRQLLNETFLLTDFNNKTKRSFFYYMRRQVIELDEKAHLAMNQTGDLGIAWLNFKAEALNDGFFFSDFEVYIYVGAFVTPWGDFSDLMEITIEHELVEIWVDLMLSADQTGWHIPRQPHGLAHQTAVQAEYQLAAQLGQVERYWQLVQFWAKKMPKEESQQFLEENLAAYQAVKKNR